MHTPITTKATVKSKRKVPDYLVYEIMDGKPIYWLSIGAEQNQNIRGY